MIISITIMKIINIIIHIIIFILIMVILFIIPNVLTWHCRPMWSQHSAWMGPNKGLERNDVKDIARVYGGARWTTIEMVLKVHAPICISYFATLKQPFLSQHIIVILTHHITQSKHLKVRSWKIWLIQVICNIGEHCRALMKWVHN